MGRGKKAVKEKNHENPPFFSFCFKNFHHDAASSAIPQRDGSVSKPRSVLILQRGKTGHAHLDILFLTSWTTFIIFCVFCLYVFPIMFFYYYFLF